MSQPVNGAPACQSPQEEDLSRPPAANRHRLPDERVGLTHHFSIAGHEGYLTVGLYPNGQPGEIFIRMAKAGSTIAGLMECFGTVVSVSLQHGVPLKVLCDKLLHTWFEPSGWTGNEELGYAKSIIGLPLPLDGIAISVGQAASTVCTTDSSRGTTRQRRAKPCSRPVFRNTFTTAMRLAMGRSVSPVGHWCPTTAAATSAQIAVVRVGALDSGRGSSRLLLQQMTLE